MYISGGRTGRVVSLAVNPLIKFRISDNVRFIEQRTLMFVLKKTGNTITDRTAQLNIIHPQIRAFFETNLIRNCFATMSFTSEQDRFIVMAHFRSDTFNPDGKWSYSLQSCIEQFMQQYPEEMMEYDMFNTLAAIRKFSTMALTAVLDAGVQSPMLS
ncbi:hypothetical protein FQA39_LY01526 [Lamprigera yunnana]|nr:hypothetical protein FQA39_LY01526 [Lamprigera yunnana]